MGNPRVIILGERCPEALRWAPVGERISVRCQSWLIAIQAGWRPNRRISTMGYDEKAEWYGVSIRESIDVLSPAFRNPALLDGWTLSDAVPPWVVRG